MATADSNNTGTDPGLDDHFSSLSMAGAAAPPDGTGAAPVFTPSSDANASSFWHHEDPSFSHYAPETNYETLQSLPLNNPLLSAQVNLPPQSANFAGYTHGTPDQLYYPPTDDPTQAGPSSSPITTTTEKPWACTHDGCSKSYRRLCDLEKHMNNHTKRRRCELCSAGGAEHKDLNRHMWTKHPNEARIRGVPKEEDQCPRCGYSGRRDNVKRHKDQKQHW